MPKSARPRASAGSSPFTGVHLVQRRALAAAGGRAGGALHAVAGAQPQAADDGLRDEHVAVGGLVAVGDGAQEAAAAGQDFEDAVRGGLRRGPAGRAAADGCAERLI